MVWFHFHAATNGISSSGVPAYSPLRFGIALAGSADLGLAIDTGTPDLQQSSDVIIRLHAEYLWSRGEKDKISYLSATKLNMPLSRWEKGQRLIPNGANVFWAVKSKPAEIDHAEFRKYLDAVFNWANSTSLSPRSATPSSGCTSSCRRWR